MRFALVAALWLILVGGLLLYLEERDRRQPVAPAGAVVEEAPMEEYTLEITPTFGTSSDPYALRGEADAAATVVVRLGGREAFRSEEPLPAGVTRSVHPVPGLVRGLNELYLRAVPPVGGGEESHAVRVRLLQGGRLVLDQTLWSEGGAAVAGTIPFTIEGSAEASHGH